MDSAAFAEGQLRVERKGDHGGVVVTLVGELDLASTPILERELQEVEASTPGPLLIDLSGLGFMDSTGLQCLLRARERATVNGHQLLLRRGPNQVQRVFELTRAVDVFDFVD